MATLEELKQAQNKLISKNKNQKKIDNVDVGFYEGLKRAGGQGLTFGFGDEIEALYKSKTKGTSYDDEVKLARAKIDKFRETNPYLAYGTEIVGSAIPTLATGGTGLMAGLGAKLGLKGATRIGALGGGAYGAGVGEDLESRAKGAVGGAVLGGAISKGASVLLPKTSELAKKFIRNKVRLTPGQAVKGTGLGTSRTSLGDLAYGIEASSTSLPGFGASVSLAKTQAIADFNKYAMMEAIENIVDKKTKKTIQKRIANLNGNEAFTVIDDLVSNKYDDILGNIKVVGDDAILNLQDRLVNSIIAMGDDLLETVGKKGDDVDVVLGRVIKNFKDNVQLDKNGNKFISGTSLKTIQKDFNKLATVNKKDGNTYSRGEVFDEINRIMRDYLIMKNPEFKNIQRTYAKFLPIQDAVQKASATEGIFTPNQLLTALRKFDLSINKKSTAKGTSPFLKFAQEGKQMVGDFIPDSGTASRLITGTSILHPSNLLKLLNPTIAGQLIYGLGGNVARRAINAPNPILRGSAPITGGLLGERAYDTTRQNINTARNALQSRLQQ